MKKNILTIEQKKKSVIDDYNDIAQEYTEKFFEDKSDEKYIDQFLLILEGKNILDVGCGNGRDCKYISQKGFKIKGIDLSKKMLIIAKKMIPNIEFELMDIANITYPDNSYDGIISNCSLFHIPVKELPQTLNSFFKNIKTKRQIVINFTRRCW